MTIRNFATCLRALALAGFVAGLANASAQAEPVNMTIVSGSSWRSADAVPTDWASRTFDDSAWSAAYAPYPNPVTRPSDIAAGTAAELMWHWTSPSAPTGSNGPLSAWFRYSFNLNLAPDSLPLIGQALIIADDNFEFFVNGQRYEFGVPTELALNQRSNGQPRPLLADFTSMLVNGTNVLAIHAADGGSLSAPTEKVYEYVYFDGGVRTVGVIPEPSQMAMLLAGLVGLLWTSARGKARTARR